MTESKETIYLSAFARNVTSHLGEDGILEKIFQVIGTKNKWCVELGALDGVYDSNSWNLINNEGWSALLIEENERSAKKISVLYKNNANVYVIPTLVSFEGKNSLDVVFAGKPIPKDFDLFILDIDGNDYHVWDSLEEYRPRVVMIEFNFTIPNEIDFVQPRDMSVQQGSSLRAIVRLADTKGYCLVATTESNAFFVEKSDFSRFNIEDNSINILYPSSRFQTKIFQLYDGTLVLDGFQRLFWHKKNFSAADIQVLPKWKRRYVAGVSPSPYVRMFKNKVRLLRIYPILLHMRLFLRSLFVK